MDRTQLQQVKLRALARDHFDASGDAVAVPFGDGAALLDGARAFVLADGGLGAAASWALKAGAAELVVIADTGAAGLAGRAALLTLPTSVWQAEGRDVRAVDPAPPPVPVAPSARWRPAIEAAGAEAVAEDGVLHAEVLGLEVAAVDHDVLRIGLNESDRQAHEELMHDTTPERALATVVAEVRRVRHAGSDHPLCLRDRDRWLRSAVVADPALAGVDGDGGLEPGPWRATATGAGVVVACGAGVDLELVVRAAEAAAAVAAERVVIAVPAVDVLPALERLAGVVRIPTVVHAVESPPWAPVT